MQHCVDLTEEGNLAAQKLVFNLSEYITRRRMKKIQLICHVAFVLFKKAFEIFNTEYKGKEEAAEENNTTGNPVNFFLCDDPSQHNKQNIFQKWQILIS